MRIDELRQGVRLLAGAPWYAATAAGVIALSLTLASTVFAIVDGVLFKPLPYAQAEQLFILSGANGGYVASMRDVRQWADAVPDAEFAAFQHVFDLGALGDDRPTVVRGAGVDRDFFKVAGIQPIIGGFTPDDFESSAGLVPALISYGVWQREFGARSNVVGARLEVVAPVNQLGIALPGVRVAGVLPLDFVYPSPQAAPDVILPIALTPDHASDRNWSVASALVRVPGALSPEVLGTRVSAVIERQAFPSPDGNRAAGIRAVSLSSWLRALQVGNFRVAFDMALALLALACINIAGLGVARRRQRGREFAVRLALGAGRWQLLKLTLSEVLPIVTAGSLAGLVATPVVLQAVLRWIPPGIALLKPPAVDWRVVAFAAVAAAVTLATTCAAEFRALPDRALTIGIGRGEGVTPRRGRFGAVLITLQIAVACVLTVGGAVVVGSLWLAWTQDPGYDVDRTVVLDFSPGTGPAPDRFARVNAFMDTCRRIPGVERVGVVGAMFLHSSYLSVGVRPPQGAHPVNVQSIPIAGDFFTMMGLVPIAGRLPATHEMEPDARVVVVSERVAKAFWPGQSAVGQTLEVGRAGLAWSVIGVVHDARYSALDTAGYGQIYSPYLVFPYSSLLIRTSSASATLRAVLAEARHVGGGFGVTRATTMTQALGESIGLRVFRGWLFGGFAAAALAITSVGILGIIAMTTSRRTREIGVRVALGATRARVVRLILAEQGWSLAIGLAAGALVASWAVGFVRSYVFQFTVYDVRLWAIAAGTILVTAMASALVPAVRASRVDPIRALHEE